MVHVGWLRSFSFHMQVWNGLGLVRTHCFGEWKHSHYFTFIIATVKIKLPHNHQSDSNDWSWQHDNLANLEFHTDPNSVTTKLKNEKDFTFFYFYDIISISTLCCD